MWDHTVLAVTRHKWTHPALWGVNIRLHSCMCAVWRLTLENCVVFSLNNSFDARVAWFSIAPNGASVISFTHNVYYQCRRHTLRINLTTTVHALKVYNVYNVKLCIGSRSLVKTSQSWQTRLFLTPVTHTLETRRRESDADDEFSELSLLLKIFIIHHKMAETNNKKWNLTKSYELLHSQL